MKLWFCLDCGQPKDLDVHGYCETCGSKAVCHATVKANTEIVREITVGENEITETVIERVICRDRVAR